MYVSQQRLFATLSLIGGGIMMIIISFAVPPMPSAPFGPADDYSFKNLAALMGLVAMGIGVAIYFLCGMAQERS
jgi:uncharacterized membrane protein YczE